MQLEGCGKVSKGQDWGRDAQALLCMEGFLTFFNPLIFFLFLMGCIVTRNLIVERTGKFGITLNESSKVVYES